MIHLDTSFLIRALSPGSSEDGVLRRWLGRGEAVQISSVSWSEFLCGPVGEIESELARRILGEPTPFDASLASTAASLFNQGGRRRGSLVDCMIAACAIHADASLATANPRDFRRLESAGLRLAVGPSTAT